MSQNTTETATATTATATTATTTIKMTVQHVMDLLLSRYCYIRLNKKEKPCLSNCFLTSCI